MYVPSSVVGEDHHRDRRLADPASSSRSSLDLARDEVGRPQARAVEAEDRDPALGHGAERRSRCSSVTPTDSPVAAAADLGRRQRRRGGSRRRGRPGRASCRRRASSTPARSSAIDRQVADERGRRLVERARRAGRSSSTSEARDRRPARRGSAGAPRSRTGDGVRQPERDLDAGDRGDLAEARLERLGRDLEQVLAALPGSSALADRGLGRDRRALDLEPADTRTPTSRRGRRSRPAETSIARAAPARTGVRPGRCAPDPGASDGPGRRRAGTSAGSRAPSSGPPTVIAAGRDGASRPPARAAWRSIARSTTFRQTSANE